MKIMIIKCLSVCFLFFFCPGEEGNPALLFGQSFDAVWSKFDNETEVYRNSLVSGVVYPVSIGI